MNSLPTMPRRTWLERASFAFAVALALLGAITMVAWLGGFDSWLAPFGQYAVMKSNTALGCIALGIALLAVEQRHVRGAGIALIAAGIGAATLAEYIFHTDLRIDEFLVRDHLLAATQHAGRMSAVMAAAMFVGGVALAWHALPVGARWRLYVEAVSGSIMAAAGSATVLGYLANLDTVIRWGSATATSPFSAAAMVLFGLALVSLAWRESRERVQEAPAWSPLPAVIACATLTLILWVGLRARERDYANQKAAAALEALGVGVSVELNQLENRFERLARNRADQSDEQLANWQAEAQETFASLHNPRDLGCVSIAFVDRNGRTGWYWPVEGNEAAVNFDHRSVPEREAAMAAAARSAQSGTGPVGSTIISALLPLPVPGEVDLKKGAAIYAPVVRGNTVIGYVAADFVYDRLLDAVSRAPNLNLIGEYHIKATLLGETIYESRNNDWLRNEALTVDKMVLISDKAFHLYLTPTNAALTADRRYFPELALAAGLGISLLLGLSIHLARGARAGQRAAELSNKKLHAENDERRRIEARLKVSDERLRLALDSTQIGIFEWSVAAGHVYYSPGLWAMLGYEHTRMPSTVEAWQSLIHPDDLPLYRRRVESQLSGIASFIEPECRVRARSGEWRWVYTRSKAVATNADGRPTRIIGTVQDITARREAEIALRESQAEARKLSLVAAKTDNPVLIGHPDGRIEWANEAFCRFMEYPLEEVIGKNPAHFMIGPETNPRIVARIRAAMARGQGISTDVVNYSKSGRKYHVHVEIQPIVGANGEVENFIAVETDITARVETELQLRRAKAEADDASRAKSDFLASMSHEIRTPMNGVIGMTSLLMETTLTAEQRDFVNTIRTSGEALLTIINDILDFSKIESGKMELERAPFEVALCIEEALELFALQASAKKLEIGYTVAPDVPSWIIGDVTRLRQIIVNLVNNAVKFTPSGSISVEVRRVTRDPVPIGFDPTPLFDSDRTILEFTIRDTGIGIPPERVDRLFKAFSQIDSSTTRKYGGTGLGLAICQRLTELMGGAIRCESKPGEGSTFMFTIQTEPAPGGTEPGFAPLPAALAASPVLCVEDHPVTQVRLRTLLEKWGATCVIVSDAAAALREIERLGRAPSLLVIDSAETDVTSPVDALAAVRCPRLVLFPFGQTAPASTDDSQPFASTSKPIRTIAFVHAITSLFQVAARRAATAAKVAERRVGEEIPLEVLLAEDNVVNQKVALRFLERLGYHADAVANGLEALTALEHRRYDLVLMDVQMPEMDGYETTRQIRSRLPAERQPKIIALTANALAGDRETAYAAGMDDYISKPVKMHEIAAAIRRHFSNPSETPSGQLIG